ncbi:hypothetical protein DGWBC_0017 [Dehalogenimonas sp. WBC-2]|nr:hypothetical protein DGWBC_0017 [Dehalogenimonas sp. WBC-2]
MTPTNLETSKTPAKWLTWYPLGNLDFSRYYKHVIRDEKELGEIQEYILANSLRWME